MFTEEEAQNLSDKASRLAAACLEFADSIVDEDKGKQMLALFHFISLGERVNSLSSDVKRTLKNAKERGA